MLPRYKKWPKSFRFSTKEFLYDLRALSYELFDKHLVELTERKDVRKLVYEHEMRRIRGKRWFNRVIKSDKFKRVVNGKTRYLWWALHLLDS